MTTHEQTTQEMRNAFDALCKSRVKAAVEAEREACAKVCDEYDDEYDVHTKQTIEGIAMQIRARGETK